MNYPEEDEEDLYNSEGSSPTSPQSVFKESLSNGSAKRVFDSPPQTSVGGIFEKGKDSIKLDVIKQERSASDSGNVNDTKLTSDEDEIDESKIMSKLIPDEEKSQRPKRFGKLISEEERKTGSISINTIKVFIKACSKILAIIVILLNILRQNFIIITDVFLAKWSSASENSTLKNSVSNLIIFVPTFSPASSFPFTFFYFIILFPFT